MLTAEAAAVDLHPVLTGLDAALALASADLERGVAESDGTVSMEWLTACLRSGASMRLWLVFREGRYLGSIVTEHHDGEPRATVVLARLRYDGEDAFGPVLEQLRAWAAGLGARLYGFSRRPGMGRLLARHGWRPRFTEYEAPP